MTSNEEQIREHIINTLSEEGIERLSLIKERVKRMSGIVDPYINYYVRTIIVGCGTLGSNVALALLKNFFTSQILIDFDDIEEHNLP